MRKSRMNLRNVVAIAICLVATTTFFSCKESNEKQITAFSFTMPQAVGVINESTQTITVDVPEGTDVTALTPSITVSEKATVSPASGVKQDFTKPVTYTVTAEDGSIQKYTVIVTIGEGSSGGGSSNASVINVTNVVGSVSSIAMVKALERASKDEIASAEYKNNGFKLNLPTTMPSKYLKLVSEYFSIPQSLVSDNTAKLASIDVSAYNSAGNKIGSFILEYRGADYYVSAHYYYVDKNVTIQGTHIIPWNCTFKKGWNVMYEIARSGGGEFTTQKPAGANLEWHYE